MDLSKKTKEELVELCDRVGLNPSGTKDELIERLDGSIQFQGMVNYPKD